MLDTLVAKYATEKFLILKGDENRQERIEVETEDPAGVWTHDFLNSSQTLLLTELLGPNDSWV